MEHNGDDTPNNANFPTFWIRVRTTMSVWSNVQGLLETFKTDNIAKRRNGHLIEANLRLYPYYC